MIHGTFYGVILISFLIGIGVQWYFREYLQLLAVSYTHLTLPTTERV